MQALPITMHQSRKFCLFPPNWIPSLNAYSTPFALRQEGGIPEFLTSFCISLEAFKPQFD
jgi:hypothetical protein